MTCSDGACRVWRDHLRVLSLGEQVHGGVDGLHVRANDDDLLGNVGHHEVVDAHHLGAGRVGQPQGVAHATGGRDYDIGGGLGDDVGSGLGIQHHLYAEYFHLALEVAAQHRQVLMGALHVIGEFQKATHGALLLVEGHGVSALGGYARRLEASRAGAHDYHVLRRGGWLGIVAAGELAGHEAEGVGGVGAAAESEVAVIGCIPMAVHAPGAGADLIDAALFQLVQVIVVHRQRSVHQDEV